MPPNPASAEPDPQAIKTAGSETGRAMQPDSITSPDKSDDTAGESRYTLASGSAKETSRRFGFCCAIIAHVMWGLFPLYWGIIDELSWVVLACHRVIWSFVFLAMAILVMPGTAEFFSRLKNGRVLGVYSVSAVLIAINWLAFLYAIESQQVLQASLGYYINPLFNVLLGVIVLGERLKSIQWIAVGLAAVGVSIMAFGASGVPWLSLTMATAFAFYTFIKKVASLPPLQSMLLETAYLMPLALVFIAYESGVEQHVPYTPAVLTFLAIGGLVTISPLAFFAAAAKRLEMTTMGILQYIGPTLQFLVGFVILQEPFDQNRFFGFFCIWIALAVFAIHSTWSSRKKRRTASVALSHD